MGKLDDPYTVDQIMRLGYYITQFTEYHYRIEDTIDFWPVREKWFDRKGYKFERQGQGFKSLVTYLTTNYPLPEDRRPCPA